MIQSWQLWLQCKSVVWSTVILQTATTTFSVCAAQTKALTNQEAFMNTTVVSPTTSESCCPADQTKKLCPKRTSGGIHSSWSRDRGTQISDQQQKTGAQSSSSVSLFLKMSLWRSSNKLHSLLPSFLHFTADTLQSVRIGGYTEPRFLQTSLYIWRTGSAAVQRPHQPPALASASQTHSSCTHVGLGAARSL